ncbi:2-phospho-L-lactate guanylyltransferase [Saccharopolyspora sp. CA-218241]|uniref:2-phospho-L-lactate guanylyltransferase n=1 Tax=Saccharopolyspora sp. CA-218241 TaxID=3240027 RepID=UPI003D99BB27
MSAGLYLLLPIKSLAAAKSRLLGAADGGAGRAAAHAELVVAVVRDTVAAARTADAVTAVVAVTSDPVLTAVLAGAGVEVLADRPEAGLNAALRHGDAVLRDRTAVRRVGALQADLPALRPAELDAALRAAGPRRAFCPDRQATGTTLLLAAPGRPLDPRFGPGSAAAHTGSGAVPLLGPWESVRCDVDTPDDLGAATALGLGPNTGALLRRAPVTSAEPPSAV